MWTSKLSTQLSRRLDNDSFHGFAAAVGVLTGAEVIRRHQKLEEPALETDHSTTATSVLAKLSGCSMLAQSSAINQHECKLQWLPDHLVSMPPGLRRQATFARLHETAIKDTLQSKYAVNWKKPLGEGTFGTVYLGKDRKTGLNVAVKRITKDFTDDESFQREMDTLLLLRDSGGHPHICGLRENYEAGEYYYLVLDLISGGEMFEHLCEKGAYSEADAARLIREVASALAFMHGIGIVHGE
jgi:predicted Ser/Thr protein kinase